MSVALLLFVITLITLSNFSLRARLCKVYSFQPNLFLNNKILWNPLRDSKLFLNIAISFVTKQILSIKEIDQHIFLKHRIHGLRVEYVFKLLEKIIKISRQTYLRSRKEDQNLSIETTLHLIFIIFSMVREISLSTKIYSFSTSLEITKLTRSAYFAPGIVFWRSFVSIRKFVDNFSL